MNQQYAEQIASEWNTKDEFSGYCGIVTAFDLSEAHYKKYDIQQVGGIIHNELWIPAEELGLFNENIIGGIRIVNVFFGDQFKMPQHNIMAEQLSKYKNQQV